MAIIYTYPRLNNPDGTELVVVSETKNENATRLIALSDIAALVPSSAGGTVTSVKLDFNHAATTDTGLRLWDGAAWVDDITITTTGSFDVGGTLNADHGGTGQFAYTQGDMLYYDATPAKLEKLAIGGAGEVLTVAGGVPTWAAVVAAPVNQVTGAVVNPSAGVAFDVTPTTGNVVATAYQYAGGALVGYVPPGGAAGEYLEGIGSFSTPPNDNATYTLSNLAHTGAGVPLKLTGAGGGSDSTVTLLEGTNVTLTSDTVADTITINSVGAVGPAKINYDGQLSFRGALGGTYAAGSFLTNKAQYWVFGDYIYLEFYLEFTVASFAATPCTGGMIMENLPPYVISPIGAAEEQGSCLVTRNDGLGKSTTLTAPKIGRTGINANDEVLFKTTNDAIFGVYRDSVWEDRDLVHEGANYVLAGTIQWAH